MTQKKYRSLNLIKRKKRFFYFKIAAVIFLVLAAITGLSYVTFLDSVQIKNIRISETKFIDQQTVEKIARTELAKKQLFIFSKNNILLMPRAAISHLIKKDNPSVESISVTSSGFQEISITIKEHQAVAYWCRDADCFYLNKEGYIFGLAGNLNSDFVKFFNVIEGEPVGQHYKNPATFAKMISLVELLRQMDIMAVSIRTDDNVSFELMTDFNMKIFFDKNLNPENVANNLNLILEKEAINRTQLRNIEYIDLRFGNRVPYKIR